MWRALCLLLLALPAWAEPFATCQLPEDARITACDYEDLSTGETARLPVVVDSVRGLAPGYRVCKRDVSHWLPGSVHSARCRSVDTATGDVSSWTATTLDRPPSSQIALQLVPGTAAPPPPPQPQMTALSDNFNRADGAVGASWSVEQGAADIASNELRINTASFTDVVVKHTTAISASAQYAKCVSGTVDFQYPFLVLRYTNSSSGFYIFYIDGNNGNVDWAYKPSVSGSSTTIQSGTLSGSPFWNGESVAITIDGTGNDTVVRLWSNVSAEAPTDVSTWDGSGPQLTFTNNPGTAADTGTYIGLGGTQGTANQVQFDAWSGGDFASGGSSIVRQMMQHLH